MFEIKDLAAEITASIVSTETVAQEFVKFFPLCVPDGQYQKRENFGTVVGAAEAIAQFHSVGYTITREDFVKDEAYTRHQLPKKLGRAIAKASEVRAARLLQGGVEAGFFDTVEKLSITRPALREFLKKLPSSAEKPKLLLPPTLYGEFKKAVLDPWCRFVEPDTSATKIDIPLVGKQWLITGEGVRAIEPDADLPVGQLFVMPELLSGGASVDRLTFYVVLNDSGLLMATDAGFDLCEGHTDNSYAWAISRYIAHCYGEKGHIIRCEAS